MKIKDRSEKLQKKKNRMPKNGQPFLVPSKALGRLAKIRKPQEK